MAARYGRSGSGEHADKESDDEREEQNGSVYVHFIRTRGETRDVGGEEMQAAGGEEQADSAAEKREQRTFRQELAEEAHAGSAHGGTHGEFAFAADRAREIEIGDIGTSDQE